MPLYLAGSSRYTSVDEVTQRKQCNRSSYHRAPSFQLSCYIDSHVTSQVLIFLFTLEIGFTGINVSFVLVVSVILNFIFSHGIASLIDCFVVCCVPFCLVRMYSIKGLRQCEPAGWVVIGESYQFVETGLQVGWECPKIWTVSIEQEYFRPAVKLCSIPTT